LLEQLEAAPRPERRGHRRGWDVRTLSGGLLGSVESGERFEHLELFEAIGVRRGRGAVREIRPGDRTAIGDGLRHV
jgi:hypothetical protein